MKKLVILTIIAGYAIFTVMGCSTAGPFVTNISSDGRGNLIIEKNTVRMNGFTGNISSGRPSTTTIKVIPESVIQGK